MLLKKHVEKRTTKLDKNGEAHEERSHQYTMVVPETKEKHVVTSVDPLPFEVGDAVSISDLAQKTVSSSAKLQ